MEEVNTYKAVCNPGIAASALLAIESITSPNQKDDYIHVVKSNYKHTDLVVKVQRPGPMLSRELAIQKLLKTQNNVVHHICDFACNYEPSVWSKPLEIPRYICDMEGDKLHAIVMEHVNHDLAECLESGVSNSILHSIFRQVGYALLEMHLNKGVYHGDINRGNILLDVQPQGRRLTYTVGDNVASVNTHGYEVLFIDFGRGHIVKRSMSQRLQNAIDEISSAFHLMSRWTRGEQRTVLESYVNDVIGCKTVKDVFALLHTNKF